MLLAVAFAIPQKFLSHIHPFFLLQSKTTPLHIAISLSHAEIAEALLKAGADVNAQNNSGKTPLHQVVNNKNRQLLDLLLRQPKIALDLVDKDFASPLWIALTTPSEDVANLLAEKGTPPVFR